MKRNRILIGHYIKNFRYETDITGSCDDALSAGFDIF
jgi:hypothetical protein